MQARRRQRVPTTTQPLPPTRRQGGGERCLPLPEADGDEGRSEGVEVAEGEVLQKVPMRRVQVVLPKQSRRALTAKARRGRSRSESRKRAPRGRTRRSLRNPSKPGGGDVTGRARWLTGRNGKRDGGAKTELVEPRTPSGRTRPKTLLAPTRGRTQPEEHGSGRQQLRPRLTAPLFVAKLAACRMLPARVCRV